MAMPEMKLTIWKSACTKFRYLCFTTRIRKIPDERHAKQKAVWGDIPKVKAM